MSKFIGKMFVDNNTSNALKNKIVKEIEDKLNANPIPNDLKASEFFKLSFKRFKEVLNETFEKYGISKKWVTAMIFTSFVKNISRIGFWITLVLSLFKIVTFSTVAYFAASWLFLSIVIAIMCAFAIRNFKFDALTENKE